MINEIHSSAIADLFVVGIGTSAGGLRALEEFFGNMPSDSKAAFVVVQHLSPDYKSLMSELLSRHTDMIVQQVEEQISLSPNTVFLIPPGQNMVIKGSRLYLTPQDRSHGRQPNFPIDLFFQSLSAEIGRYTIGIVLSGTGSDGSRGIQEISEMGGIVLAQDPATAEFDGMPKSAIATGVVDLVLSPDELAHATYQFLTSPNVLKAFRDDQQDQTLSAQLNQIVEIIEHYDDIDFGHYKSSSISRRIQRRCLIAGYKDLNNYIRRLESSEEERNHLRNDLLITVTRFFRDKEAWHFLATKILPELIDNIEPNKPLRIWVTACATGEEAYSMAILVQEILEQRQLSIEAKIFATDLDQDALGKASLGIYPSAIVNKLSQERVDRFFTARHDGSFEVARSIREMIIFANHNLTKDAGFTQIDLVTCRNVLIYMQSELQTQVLKKLHFSLKVNGILFLGESETLGVLEEEFKVVHRKWKFYQKLRDIKLALIEPALASLNLGRSRIRTVTSDKNSRFDPLLETAFKTLLNQNEATCLLVDRQLQLLYVCGDSLRLLRVPDGRRSNELLEMLPQSLQLPLSTGLHRIRQGRDNRVHYSSCQINESGYDDSLTVSIDISHQPANNKTSEFFLVKITRENIPDTAVISNKIDTSDDTAQYIFQLEGELQRTRENLQATIEELETTNEEQQATNEELIASNEELQSTNEELQSVNEELYTVNAEYQSKIQELTEVNNDLDNLLGNIEVGVIFLDNEMRIRKFTSAAKVAYNLVESDLSRPIAHLSHNIDNIDLVDLLIQVKKNGRSIEQEVQVKQQGPHFLMRIFPYVTDNQKTDGLILTFVNVDDLKKTHYQLEAVESQLRESNKILEQKVQKRTLELENSQHFLESINQATPNSIYIYDLIEKHNIYSNRPLEEMLGYTKDDFQLTGAEMFTHLLHPDDLEKVSAYHQAIAESTLDNECTYSPDKLFSIEYRVRGADGNWHWFYSQDIVFACSEQGNPTQILGIAVDISDRKIAEKELRDSEFRYRRLYESTPAMMYSINQKGELISVSNQWLKTFGYERDEVIGRKSTDFLSADSRQYAEEEVLPEFRETGSCRDISYQWICKDGSVRDVLLSAIAEYDDSGAFVHSLSVLIDVTEHNKIQTELISYRSNLEELVKDRAAEIQEANHHLQAEVLERQQAESKLANRAQALEQSNADLEQFAYVISHDLQEPLRAMTVFAQLLEGDYGKHLDTTAKDYINNIVEGGIRMHGLINGILAFSRATHQESTFETLDLEQVLIAVLENLSSAIGASQATVNYDILPTLNIDKNQIIQLFQNLIGNAIKFRGSEPPCIYITAKQQPDSWLFSFKDNGIGIPKEQQERTFALFQRLHTREEIDGYGIGLAICKKIVERHQGHIWVDSEPGNGSTFYFTLANDCNGDNALTHND